MKRPVSARNALPRGLCLLASLGVPPRLASLPVVAYDAHPLGLPYPRRKPMRAPYKVRFAGPSNPRNTLRAFAEEVCLWLGPHEESSVSRLRVIEVPFGPKDERRSHSYFEATIGSVIVLSGEVAGFHDLGKESRAELETLFGFLSHVYGTAVERIALDRAIPPELLYRDR